MDVATFAPRTLFLPWIGYEGPLIRSWFNFRHRRYNHLDGALRGTIPRAHLSLPRSWHFR